MTSANYIEYIHKVADYRLNKQLRKQSVSFRAGVADVLPISWLAMFHPTELQTLLSGASMPVDVEDLKAHTKYGGSKFT